MEAVLDSFPLGEPDGKSAIGIVTGNLEFAGTAMTLTEDVVAVDGVEMEYS